MITQVCCRVLESVWLTQDVLRTRCTGFLSEMTPQIISILSFKPSNLPKLSFLQLRTAGVEKKMWKDCENRNKLNWQLSGSKASWRLLCVGNKLKPLGSPFPRWFIRSLPCLIQTPAVWFLQGEILHSNNEPLDSQWTMQTYLKHPANRPVHESPGLPKCNTDGCSMKWFLKLVTCQQTVTE